MRPVFCCSILSTLSGVPAVLPGLLFLSERIRLETRTIGWVCRTARPQPLRSLAARQEMDPRRQPPIPAATYGNSLNKGVKTRYKQVAGQICDFEKVLTGAVYEILDDTHERDSRSDGYTAGVGLPRNQSRHSLQICFRVIHPGIQARKSLAV